MVHRGQNMPKTPLKLNSNIPQPPSICFVSRSFSMLVMSVNWHYQRKREKVWFAQNWIHAVILLCQLPIQSSPDALGHLHLHQVPFAWWANKKKMEKEKRNCDNLGPDCDLAQNFTPDIGHSEVELQRSNKNALFAVNFWSLLFGMEKYLPS